MVGTSMGAAVIWRLQQAHGLRALGVAGAVLVDQAPLQNRAEGWECGSKGIYDGPSLAAVQAALLAGMGAFADANAACCLTKPVAASPPGLAELLRAETMRCDGAVLGELMADHTALDWRPVLPTVDVPCLSLWGDDSGCFPPEGLRHVARSIPGCEEVVFEGCNHWLYIEEPARFAAAVGDFACRRCLA